MTKGGVPRRIMIPTSEASLLEDFQALVFARARKAVRAMRSQASTSGPSVPTRFDIEREIKAARRARKQKARHG